LGVGLTECVGTRDSNLTVRGV